MPHAHQSAALRRTATAVVLALALSAPPRAGAAATAIRPTRSPLGGAAPHTAIGTNAPLCRPPNAADVRRRFRGLLGPMGCEDSAGLTPQTPDECLGAYRFVRRAMRNYDDLYRAGGCTGAPPDLSARVRAYELAFEVENDFVDHEIPRGEYTIYAREYGADRRGNGPTIVLMHGFPDDQRLFDLVAPTLGNHHHTIAFDFVGYGSSSLYPDDHTYSFDDQRSDLDAVVAYFDTTRYVPVVHDASGFPGIDWALDNPDRVTALVILNSVYMATEDAAPPYPLRALMDEGFRPVYESLVGDDALMDRALFDAQVGAFMEDDARRAQMLPLFSDAERVAQKNIRGLTEVLFSTIIDRTSNTATMETFPRPVYIVFGEDDPHLNVGIARAFDEVFPDSTLVLVADANHYVQIDQPDAVIEQILAAAAE